MGIKIDELTSASALTGAELIPLVQGGVTKQISALSLLLSPLTSSLQGAVGDGVVDDTAAFNTAIALASGKALYIPVPPSGYKLTSKLTIPANTTLLGLNKQTTKLLHAYNGDFCDLGDGAALIGLYIEGQGVTFTGKGILYSGTNSRQRVHSCKVINFDGACFDYAVAAGSTSSHIDVEAYRVAAGTGTGRYAFVISATQQLAAVPRKFSHIETGGQCAFDFGGCNSVYISDSFLADLNYTPDSRAVRITGSRLANQAALAMDGHGNGIVNCDVNALITVQSGADNIQLENSYNNGVPVDSSGNNRNLITHIEATYAPAFTAAGTAFVLGNGTLTGSFSRVGNKVTFTANLTIGNTTTVGTGAYSISLPVALNNTIVQVIGAVVINRGGTIYTGVLQTAGGVGVTTAQLLRDTSGSVTFNSPGVLASTDTIRMSGSYQL